MYDLIIQNTSEPSSCNESNDEKDVIYVKDKNDVIYVKDHIKKYPKEKHNILLDLPIKKNIFNRSQTFPSFQHSNIQSPNKIRYKCDLRECFK
jgi:hypothetical protein